MATVLCAMFSPSMDQVRICSTGHLPPVIPDPGQPAASADVGPRPAHQYVQPERRQVSTLHFPPGAALGLYADGLVQRRDQPIDQGIA